MNSRFIAYFGVLVMMLLSSFPLALALASGVLVVLLLASIVFLCTVVLVAALMLRDKWGDIGDSDSRRK